MTVLGQASKVFSVPVRRTIFAIAIASDRSAEFYRARHKP